MIKEFLGSIRSIMHERVISPLSGVLTLVWFGFNWKPVLLMILSDTPVEARIEVIQKDYSNPAINIWNPLLASLIVLILYPFLSAAAFWLWEKVSAWKQIAKHRFSLEIPLTLQQSLEVRKEIEEVNNRFSTLLSNKENQIKELQAANSQLKITLKEQSSEPTIEYVKATRVSENKSAGNMQTYLEQEVPDAIRHDWIREYSNSSMSTQMKIDSTLHALFNNSVDENSTLDKDQIIYALSKGLAQYDNNKKIALTPKARVLAQVANFV